MAQFKWVNGRPVPIAGAPAAGQTSGSAPSGAAPKVANKGTNGSDPRFSVAGLGKNDQGQYVDAAGNVYDDGGRMVSGDWSRLEDSPGLPPSNQSESYDVYAGTTSQYGGPGGGGTGGGGGGAFYEQLKSMLKAQGTSQLSDTQAAIRKALIGFGLDPTGRGYEDKLGAVDDVTKSLIAKNTESGISYYARLIEGQKDKTKQMIGNLSRIGQRRSGTKGYKLRRGQLDFDRLFQDSLQELLGQVGNQYQGYASGEQQRQMQLMQALMNSGSGGGGGPVGQANTTYSNPYLVSYDPNKAIVSGSSVFGSTPTYQGGATKGLISGGGITAPSTSPRYGIS